MTAKYGARMFGGPIGASIAVYCATITAAREYAESYGSAADSCTIERKGKVVALHVRDTSGSGRRWFRGEVAS